MTKLSEKRRAHHLRQVQLFKSYFNRNNEELGGDGGVATCAKCRSDVNAVWDLNQQIEAIVDRVKTDMKIREEGGWVSRFIVSQISYLEGFTVIAGGAELVELGLDPVNLTIKKEASY